MADNHEIKLTVNVDDVGFQIAEAWFKRLTNDVNELANAYARLEACAVAASKAVNATATARASGKTGTKRKGRADT